MGSPAGPTCSKPSNLSFRKAIAIDREKLADGRFHVECFQSGYRIYGKVAIASYHCGDLVYLI
jgi:hypothetical protein